MNKKSIIVQLLLLSLFTFLIYSNTIKGEFLFDDEHFIVRNPYIRDWACIKDIFLTNVTSGIGFKDNFYRPLSVFVWLLLNKTFGLNPAAFHLTNIFIHISCGVLIYLLLQKLFKNSIAAFAGSAFFLVHPLQTEAVSYASGTGDILSFLFLLIAVYSYLSLRGACRGEFIRPTRGSPIFYYLIFCISAILAMLAKERAVMLVFLLPIFELSFLIPKGSHSEPLDSHSERSEESRLLPHGKLREEPQKPRFLVSLGMTNKKQLALYGFLILTAVFWFYLRSVALGSQNTFNFYSSQNIYSANLLVRLYTFFYAFLIYLKLIIIPYPLHMERTIPVFTYFLQPKVMFGFFLLFIGLILAVRSFSKKRIFFFSYFWFLIALAPTSGIVPINALIMEHWLYFSLFGVSVFIAYLVNNFTTKARKHEILDFFRVFVVISYILILCFVTFNQNRFWKNPYIFFQHTLKYNPDSVAANNNFAMALSDKGKLDKAIFHYKKAISINDTFPQSHHNLARIYIAKNDLKSALNEYYKALEISPDFVFTHQDLTNIFTQLGEKQKAEYHQKRVREILNPTFKER